MKTNLLVLMFLLGSTTMFAASRWSIGVNIGGPVYGGGYYVAAPAPPPPPPAYYYGPPRAPGYGYTWVDGYYYPVRGRYAWRSGYWARPPYARARWVEPRYYGGRYYHGRWR